MKAVEVETRGWACPPSPPSNSTGWPTFPTAQFPSDADLHYSSPNVQAWSVGNQMQLDVVHQVKQFFADQEDSDSETDSDSDSDECGANGDCSLFFTKLFEDNEQLREFYLKNYEKGEFGCLVCGGVGFIKRFKDCVSLVQHTKSIAKTKKMKAHRGFGQVVCKLLGWDINKLPSSKTTHHRLQGFVTENVVIDKQTVEEGFAVNATLVVPEIVEKGGSSAATLEENVQLKNGDSLDCDKVILAYTHLLQALRGNNAGRDIDGDSAAAEPKGEDEATGNDNLPTISVSNLPQEHHREDESGKNEFEDSK